MTRTGLLFGSFNPVHIGHIAIAGYMKEFAGMDEIWFIVSPQNPQKSRQQLAGPSARLHMVKLAVEKHHAFTASDVEFDMPLPSYTLNTMQKLVKMYTARDFYLIIGTDNIDSIKRWKDYKILLREYKFLVYPRKINNLNGSESFITGSGTSSENINTGLKANLDPSALKPETERTGNYEFDLSLFNDATLVAAPMIEVSSSFIREAIKAGKDMRAFVPEGAYDYLIKNQLYH